MKQYTEIADVPTDLEVVDSMGFTWRHGQDPSTGGTAWFFAPPGGSPWIRSAVAVAGQSTAFMGPFAEVR